MMRFTNIVFLLIILSAGMLAQNTELPEKLKDLNLSSLKGEVPVYYSEGYEERAAYFQGLAEPASVFFKKPEVLGTDVKIGIAILSAEDWAKYTKLPYGIAHIKMEPPMAILAASTNNVMVKGMIAEKDQLSITAKEQLNELEATYEEAAESFVDLIGFHEMGHIYAHHYQCSPTWPAQKWLGEFMATYLAYAYMKENQSKLANLWNVMINHFVLSSEQKHTTIADFEELYLGVGGSNYRWYQAAFHQKVVEVFNKVGISFVHDLKKSLADNPEPAENDPFRLKELDAIYAGFTDWAKGTDGNLR